MKVFTRAKAIKMKCLDCCGGSYAEVKACDIFDCPLWVYRSGKPKEDEIDIVEKSETNKEWYRIYSKKALSKGNPNPDWLKNDDEEDDDE